MQTNHHRTPFVFVANQPHVLLLGGSISLMFSQCGLRTTLRRSFRSPHRQLENTSSFRGHAVTHPRGPSSKVFPLTNGYLTELGRWRSGPRRASCASVQVELVHDALHDGVLLVDTVAAGPCGVGWSTGCPIIGQFGGHSHWHDQLGSRRLAPIATDRTWSTTQSNVLPMSRYSAILGPAPWRRQSDDCAASTLFGGRSRAPSTARRGEESRSQPSLVSCYRRDSETSTAKVHLAPSQHAFLLRRWNCQSTSANADHDLGT